jgi:hypothetical protein
MTGIILLRGDPIYWGRTKFLFNPLAASGTWLLFVRSHHQAETSQFVGIFDFIYQGPYLSLGFGF